MDTHKSENQCQYGDERRVLNKRKPPQEGTAPCTVTRIFGMRFRDVSLDTVADSLIDDVAADVKRKIYFVNAHCINIAERNQRYASILRAAPYLYADGLGMSIAARIMGARFENNVNGTDLFPILCEKAARNKIPVAFFGSAPGVAATCAERMEKRYPGLRVVWCHHGYADKEKHPELIDEINCSGAKILMVAKGVPLQELWIDENASKLDVSVLVGVGALFDFFSGSVQRAPLIWRKMRMEWFFRLIMEPRRLFYRYIVGNPEFLLRVAKMRITGTR